jgi:pimeloyl-ACP methyl ester carboxylesterase
MFAVTARKRLVTVLLVSAAALTGGPAAAPVGRAARSATGVRAWTISYTAHNGAARLATLVLPDWYGPTNNPPLPVVISPHGRGATGRSNAEFWGSLPGIGRFIVVSPDGMGRRLKSFSYGYSGQIDDLARMPDLAQRALPWLRIDRTRIYALGSSMGGQETLLLVARHSRLLAGAAAMDSVTDLARRYRQLPSVPCDPRCLQQWGEPYGIALQSSMRREVGGTPAQAEGEYARRSALSQARAIAFAGVPLQVWWSREDRIVIDQAHQSEAFARLVRELNPCAPLTAYIGDWAHSKEMRSTALLPIALIGFGLLPQGLDRLPESVRAETQTCPK